MWSTKSKDFRLKKKMNHIALDPNGGKGDKWRRVDFKKYRDNYDKIFSKKKGKKDDRRISKTTEKDNRETA